MKYVIEAIYNGFEIICKVYKSGLWDEEEILYGTPEGVGRHFAATGITNSQIEYRNVSGRIKSRIRKAKEDALLKWQRF